MGVPRPVPGAALTSTAQLPALRYERRVAQEQYEQYRRAMYELEVGSLGTTAMVASFWAGRSDVEHDQLAARLAEATAILNQALTSLGLPPET
jgi:hypothetical protein